MERANGSGLDRGHADLLAPSVSAHFHFGHFGVHGASIPGPRAVRPGKTTRREERGPLVNVPGDQWSDGPQGGLTQSAASVKEHESHESMHAERRCEVAMPCRLLLEEPTLSSHRHCLGACVHPQFVEGSGQMVVDRAGGNGELASD